MKKELQKRYNVEVTAEDIKKGVKESYTTCPIAKAIRRVAGKKDINVLGRRIILNGFYYTAPEKVSTFIDKFDMGKPVKPFKFVLKKI